MKICKIEGCESTDYYAKELCRSHYDKERNLKKRKQRPPKICKYPECNNIVPLKNYFIELCSDECKRLEFNRKQRLKYRENPIKNNIRTQKYWAENKDKMNKWQKEWYEKNGEDKKRRFREQYKEDEELRIKRAASRQSRRALGKIMPEFIKNQLIKQDYKCANIFCRCDLKNKNNVVSVEHLIPITKGGINTPDNLRIWCKHCNSSKCDTNLKEYYFNKLDSFLKTGKLKVGGFLCQN